MRANEGSGRVGWGGTGRASFSGGISRLASTSQAPLPSDTPADAMSRAWGAGAGACD
jgi:hypothetical protein